MLAATARTQAQPVSPGHGKTFETSIFTVRIEVWCPEGEATCDRVFYRGESKRRKKVLNLRGSTKHSLCADKIAPCRFLGYTFKNGAFKLFVCDAGELLVRAGKWVVVEETGEWQ